MFQLVVLSVFVAVALAAPAAINPQLDGRVVGGEDVDIADYPHQISLLYYGSHNCGGSIIDRKYVVTAAHCTAGATPSALSIRAGSSIHNSGGVVVQVARINQNPQYNPSLTDYDITVLELATPLNFGTGINKIGLPAKDEPIQAGADAETSGWGATSEGGPAPNVLQAVTVQMVSNADCNAAYGDGRITARMNCAGAVGGGKDACQGDSGGPLTVDGVLIGIVSWGRGCARPDYPGVYASVPNLRNYITDITGI